MKYILIGLFVLSTFSSFAMDKELEDSAIIAYKKSDISQKNAPCSLKGEEPKATLIEGGGDMMPIRFTVLVSQEFNCGFFSRSIFAKVLIDGDFDYENDNFDKFIYTVESLKVIGL